MTGIYSVLTVTYRSCIVLKCAIGSNPWKMQMNQPLKNKKGLSPNKEATEKLIPVRKKARRVQFSKDTRVIEARKKINDAYNAYQQDTCEEKRLIYKQAKKSLETTYNDVVEEDVTNKLKKG